MQNVNVSYLFMSSFVLSVPLSVVCVLCLLFCVSSLISIKVVSIITISHHLDEH